MTAEIEIFPIGIGEYDGHPPLDVKTEIERLAATLADFGAEIARPWHTPMIDRGRDAVDARLIEWSENAGGPTILYWLGHGWSDNETAALLHARSTQSTGLPPVELARRIATWEARGDPDRTWLLVVIDACQSARFAELLAAEIDKLQGRRRIIVVGTAGRGSTTLGRFTNSLDTAVRHTFAADAEIAATRLSDELVRTIPDGVRRILNVHDDVVLHRSVPVPEYSGPLDLRAVLADVLAMLPEDERRHFVSKAQGGELRADQDVLGEVGWYFTGRHRERRAIIDWLAGDSGMLVVTGRAGSGKSALLGDILVRSRPKLAQVLLDHDMIDHIAGDPPRPFDCALHLTGLSSYEVIARISKDLAVSVPDQHQPFTAQLDHFAEMVGALPRPPRLLVDALDEAVDPLQISALLRRLGATPGIPIVVGTRASTQEGPDRPDPDDTDLLDALASREPLVIERDPDAIAAYVTRRLADANLGATRDSSIERAATSIRDAGQEFLYARLAVHELLAQPELLTSAVAVSELLGPDHRSIFAAAVRRLARNNPHFRPLLVGLALAQGRGAPIRDGVWIALADAATGARVTDEAVPALLADAAPYLALDSDHGQTVYRLAHRTFAEHLTADDDITQRQHQAITRRAIAQLGQPHPNIYWRRYTSGHAAGGALTAWEELDRSSSILETLDPDAVASDAMRTVFGFAAVPPHIAGVISASHILRTANQADHAGIRQLATAYHMGRFKAETRPDATSAWAVEFATVQQRHLHATLTGHTGTVRAVAAVRLPGGRTLLATGSLDATVRLWDPTTGTPVGELTGHTGAVMAVAAVPLPDGRTLLATGSDDATVRLWDPTTGTPVGNPLTGHTGAVRAVAAVPLPGRTLLASGSGDRTVRLWDPTTRTPVGEPLTGHFDGVRAVAAVPLPDGRTLLATGSDDRTVRLWDPTTRTPVGDPLTGHFDGVRAVAAVPLPGRTLLATGSGDRTVRLWDPTTGTPVGDPLTDHTGPVTAVAAVPLPDGRTLLATGSGDRTVRLWDPTTGTPVGDPLTGHTERVRAVVAVPLPDGRTLLATGSDDRTVRLWDPTTGTPVGDPLTGHTERVRAVAAVPLPDGRTLLATGSDDATVRLWDPTTGTPVGDPLTGHTERVRAVAAVPLPDGRTLLAIGSDDRTVRLWDPTTRTPVGDPLTGHTGGVMAVAAVPLPDGRTLLATGSDDRSVRLWDPTTRTPVGDPLTGHTGGVMAVAAVPLPDGRTLLATGSGDRSVRLWDPTTRTPVGDPLTGHTGGVTAVAAVPLPDGRTLLATAGLDKTMLLWDPTSGALVGDPLTGHASAVWAVVAVPLPDGRTLLATAGLDKTVRLWDPTSRVCTVRMPLSSSCRSICNVGFGRIAVGMDDGVVVLDVQTNGSRKSTPADGGHQILPGAGHGVAR